MHTYTYIREGCPCGVMVTAMGCEIGGNQFEFKLHYLVYFRTNNLGKGINPFIFPAMR